jgi:hypothetical protein
MSTLKVTIPASILLVGLFVCTTSSYGTPEYAKKEKKGCVYCHVKMVPDKVEMTKNLTETGTLPYTKPNVLTAG